MCEYCEPLIVDCGVPKGYPIACIDDGEIMTICTDTRVLIATDGGRYERAPYAMKINYCPMCGRNLKG